MYVGYVVRRWAGDFMSLACNDRMAVTVLFQVNIGGILGSVTYCQWHIGYMHLLKVVY